MQVIFEYVFINYKLDLVSQRGVGGIVVSIAAFQAVDPGSIPGQRMRYFFVFSFSFSYKSIHYYNKAF